MAELVIHVEEAKATLLESCTLTSGMVGTKVRFEFADSWAALSKTVVFSTGEVAKDIINVENEAVIPPEVLRKARRKLYIGVYGVNEEGTVVIPTRWVCAGTIYAGADPSGDTTTDASLPVWAQLQAMIGDSEAIPDYVRAAAEALAEKVLSITGESVTTSEACVNILDTVGYEENVRLRSSGVTVEADGCDTTGYIPCVVGDVLRFQGITYGKNMTNTGHGYIHSYDAAKTWIGSLWYAADYSGEYAVFGADGNLTKLTIPSSSAAGIDNAACAYIRLCADNIDDNSIITVNQEITTEVVSSGGRVPFNLAFLTDLHWNDADRSRYEAARAALQVIHETAPLDLVCFGGDYIFNWWEETSANAREDLRQCRKVFENVPAPAIWLRGNHENNGYAGQRLAKQEVFNRVSRAQQTLPGYVSNPDDPYGCYGYLDFENAKVRVIAVNTSDNDQMGTTETAEGNAAALIGCHNISGAQLQWIADAALDLSKKSDPKLWTILILSHIPVYSTDSWSNAHTYTDDNGDTWTCNVQNLETLMAACRDMGLFSISLNGDTVRKDFSGTTPAGSIVFINGHGHALNQLTHNDFTYITCPNVCNNGEKESADGKVYTKTGAGTAGETAFQVLTVDSANQKVHAWIYGAGYDREIPY